MRTVVYVVSVLVVFAGAGCDTTKKHEAESSARAWAKGMGLEVTGLSCTSGGCSEAPRCAVHAKRVDGASLVVSLACDSKECQIAERAVETTIVYQPMPMSVGK